MFLEYSWKTILTICGTIKIHNKPDGYVYEEIAECYLKQQNSQYKEYAQKAYDELSKDVWLQNKEAERLQRLFELATL